MTLHDIYNALEDLIEELNSLYKKEGDPETKIEIEDLKGYLEDIFSVNEDVEEGGEYEE